ncbi:hypothetical protein GCM10027161_24460 [Microbispora hainanensis]
MAKGAAGDPLDAREDVTSGGQVVDLHAFSPKGPGEVSVKSSPGRCLPPSLAPPLRAAPHAGEKKPFSCQGGFRTLASDHARPTAACALTE